MTRKHDHLGSARITLDNAARVIESQSYTAYGDHRTHDGEASRTSYIGRETDKEADLGFYGVRMYDPTYGRFLSVDPLWGKYLPLQSYQYAANNPVMMLDDGGDTVKHFSKKQEELYHRARAYIVAADPEAEEYFRAIENSRDHFFIAVNHGNENAFEEGVGGGMASTREQKRHTIWWDPTAAHDYAAQGVLSPAMILFHEVVHAAGVVTGDARWAGPNDGTPTNNAEEARVILVENAVAQLLVEAVRTFHNLVLGAKQFGVGYGRVERVKDPTKGGKKPSKELPTVCGEK